VPAFTSRFWFCAGSPSCQDLLKYEVSSRHPDLRFAFSRPGLLTFKSPADLLATAPIHAHLAILGGLSIGGAKSQGDLVPLVRQAGLGADGGVAVEAYAWPTDEEDEPVSHEQLLVVKQAALEELGGRADGAGVALGIVVPPPAHPDYGYWVFVRTRGPAPISVEKVTPPLAAPSRAYSKLVEALAYFGIQPSAGEAVLELGAAPGGATLALLERGLSVVAVDPAKMDPSLEALAAERGLQLRHLEKPAQALTSSDLSGLFSPARWLVSDMNLAPPVAVQQILRARALIKKTLRGAILTLKLNDTSAVDTLPRVLVDLERAFGHAPRVAHLPSHRREVVAVLGAF